MLKLFEIGPDDLDEVPGLTPPGNGSKGSFSWCGCFPSSSSSSFPIGVLALLTGFEVPFEQPASSSDPSVCRHNVVRLNWRQRNDDDDDDDDGPSRHSWKKCALKSKEKTSYLLKIRALRIEQVWAWARRPSPNFTNRVKSQLPGPKKHNKAQQGWCSYQAKKKTSPWTTL